MCSRRWPRGGSARRQGLIWYCASPSAGPCCSGWNLVAADLVRTVAVAPTLDNVLVLRLIVVIRTFLSFSLETEIEGVVPWRRAAMGGAGTIRRAAASALEPKPPP